MQRHAGSLAVLLVLGLAGGGCNDGTEGQEGFQATLSGSEEVPPRPSGASGSAGVTVDGNTVNITDPTGAVNGILIQASAPASDLQGGISLADLVSNIRSGNAYVNVHTTTFPGGEIRGQLQALNLD
jgi:hypothetical protein